MKRKMKMPRGFYKGTKQERKEHHYGRKIKFMEQWTKHKTDSSKDIRVLIEWMNEGDFNLMSELMVFINSVDYEDVTWSRFLYIPKTKREKVIFASQVVNIPSIRKYLNKE